MIVDHTMSAGFVRWELRDVTGRLKASGRARNIETQVGDQMYAERGSGITTLASPTGMKLGTGSTTPAKTGAGAALATYLTNSHQAFDSTYPQSALNGSSRRITYKVTFAAGKATTGSPITEAVIVNNASLTDATSTAANTIHRVLLTGIVSKGALDSLTVIWSRDSLGA